MAPNDNPQPLSPERLAGIRARVEAASPGPWCTDESEIYQGTEYIAGAEWIGDTCRTYGDGGRADAQFIAAARTDVPDLLAEVARLQRRVAELERPEVERRRAEVVLSHQQLAAQAREDRDYEGEAEALRLLSNRQAEWKAEDAKAGWSR